MANELTINWSGAFAKGGTAVAFPDTAHQTLRVTVAGSKILQNRQIVGTVEEVLLLGDCGVGGYVFLVNRDAANFVSVRAATGAANLIRILAGEGAFFRVAPAITPYVIADTAPVELEYLLVEA